MNAYHDEAVMSMHMAYPEWCGNVQGAEKLNEYMVRIILLQPEINKLLMTHLTFNSVSIL